MNDILFGNNNKAIVKKIAKRCIKANKRRNLFIIFAVILTTVLFATFFSIGGGFFDQIRQIQQRQHGTAHATVKFLSQGQYDALAAYDMKKDISYTRLVGAAINTELTKVVTEVRYAEDESAKSFLCYPTTGTMPQGENEIATSTLVLDALGVSRTIGTPIHLSISVDGEYYEKDFTLSGFWDGYALANAQEAWISQKLADQIAPASYLNYAETGKYAGLFCADINFAHSWNLRGQLNTLFATTGITDAPDSVNPSYEFALSSGKVDLTFILAIVALLGTILLAGYLIIYNLFYISVTQDIHFFGLLRTIGASGKQIKAIVRKQVFQLAIVGLPFGLLFGYLIGRLLLPFVLTQVNVEDTGIYRINPLVLIGAALFALLTIYISSFKPCNYAAKISAVEAVRYSGDSSGNKVASKKSRKTTIFFMAIENLKRSKKKAVLVILSLSLSLILLNTTYTAINGFDVDAYIAKNVVADFYITDFSVRNYGFGSINLSGISKSCLSEISNLPGLENKASVYAKDIFQPLPDNMIKRLEKVNADNSSAAAQHLLSEKNTSTLVYGVDDFLNDKITLTAGEWNTEQWATGNYVIIDDFFYQGIMGAGQSPFYQIGDSVTLADQNGTDHTYTVMGIGDLDYNLDAHYASDYGLSIILPEVSYRTLYGDTQPLCTVFNVDENNTENTENWINQYCGNTETNLTYISHKVYEKEFESDKTTYSIVGGILAIILALIGLLNYVNAVATSIITRQKELAMLGAIGMSRKQMKQMLIYESMAYIGLAFLLTATIGSVIGYFICANLVSDMWAFVYRFTLTPVLLCLPFLVAIAIIIPLVYNKQINKKSIVERLSISE